MSQQVQKWKSENEQQRLGEEKKHSTELEDMLQKVYLFDGGDGMGLIIVRISDDDNHINYNVHI